MPTVCQVVRSKGRLLEHFVDVVEPGTTPTTKGLRDYLAKSDVWQPGKPFRTDVEIETYADGRLVDRRTTYIIVRR